MSIKVKLRNMLSHNDSFKKYSVHPTVRMNCTKITERGSGNVLTIGKNVILIVVIFISQVTTIK